MQLPSAYPFVVIEFSLKFREKQTSILVCLLCNYLRRVDFFVVQFLLEFRQQFIDFGVLLDAFTYGVSIFVDKYRIEF